MSLSRPQLNSPVLKVLHCRDDHGVGLTDWLRSERNGWWRSRNENGASNRYSVVVVFTTLCVWMTDCWLPSWHAVIQSRALAIIHSTLASLGLLLLLLLQKVLHLSHSSSQLRPIGHSAGSRLQRSGEQMWHLNINITGSSLRRGDVVEDSMNAWHSDCFSRYRLLTHTRPRSRIVRLFSDFFNVLGFFVFLAQLAELCFVISWSECSRCVCVWICGCLSAVYWC